MAVIVIEGGMVPRMMMKMRVRVREMGMLVIRRLSVRNLNGGG